MKKLILFGLVLSIVLAGCVEQVPTQPPVQPGGEAQLKKFSSYEELSSFVKAGIGSSYLGGIRGGIATTALEKAADSGAPAQAGAPAPVPSTTTSGAEDYSATNIQVQGVDEADIVKTDGKYIYAVSGNKVVIVNAYPAENAAVLSTLEFNGTPNEIFINKDKLVVFGQEAYTYYPLKAGGAEPAIAPKAEAGIMAEKIMPPIYYSPKTFLWVYDVSDREKPVLERNVSLTGNYFDSRMIGEHVYAVINQPTYYREGPEPIPLPEISSGSEVIKIPASEIYYFDYPDYSYMFTIVLAINTQDDSEELASKTFLMGATQSIFVSLDNIYVTYTKRLSEIQFSQRIIDEVIIPVVPENVKSEIRVITSLKMINAYEKRRLAEEIFRNYTESLDPEKAAEVMKDYQERMEDLQIEIAKEIEKTVVHKISVSNGNIEYKTKGEVPGYILNQFSMDESNGYFRIATTTGESWGFFGRERASQNHVYILDSELNIVGKLEDLAQGERIYSARFLGDKAYLVTFRQIDPLFVIDLKEPSAPKVLGYLKIPGVSDYLHPYDENHIIGIGRDATEEGRILGLKLSLFDISDVSKPKEISKYIIGKQGTDSEALYDHKAFLFSKEKALLVIPVSEYSYGPVIGAPEKMETRYWQGAYIFNLELENGFALKGKITHTKAPKKENGYYYDYASQIRRSLYIENVLYTISQRMVKMNGLDNLKEINKVELPFEENVYPPVRIMG